MSTNNNNKDKKTKTETTRKPLPQSSIVGKRKEIFNLNTTKEKKSGVERTNFSSYLYY